MLASLTQLRTFATKKMAAIAVGAKIPSATLHENTPGGAVTTDSIFGAGSKVVLFAVPGAFTPGCSKTHLPGYVEAAEKLKKAGATEIVCVSVNDAFVMAECAS